MIIVGGTYREEVTKPRWNEIGGSGMRAAAAIAAQVPGLVLLTAMDSETAGSASVSYYGFEVEARTVERTDTVAFRYFTPLSTPTVIGADATAERIVADDDTVCVFGMVERGEVAVRARRGVFDPQRPRTRAPLDLTGIAIDELVLVVNMTEARRLTGTDDIDEAAGRLLSVSDAVAVVVKRGAAGARIFPRRGEPTSIGAHPTSSVWTLGSGDTFAAGFTYAFANGADFVEAARVGSASAASWCGSRIPAVPAEVLNGSAPQPPLDGTENGTVYLASPFFTLGELWLVELARGALLAQGVTIFSPWHDVGLGGVEVAAKDLAGLDRSTAILALLDYSDAGTVFECGYGTNAGVPIVGYSEHLDEEAMKMIVGTGAEYHNDFTTAVYRAAWRSLGAR